ncbi:MAG: TonB-dependent receptor [Gemmatimonadetes bacterium]|nr:MAG: TonB-dependent receptor [Gemmatimonadota bacterium]
MARPPPAQPTTSRLSDMPQHSFRPTIPGRCVRAAARPGLSKRAIFHLAAALGATTAALLPGAGTAQQAAVELTDTVRVTVESRTGAGGRTRAAQVVTAAELAALPVRSISEALTWAFGVDLDARSPAQADVSIRGASFEQVVVLVDGVRASDPQTGHFDLDLTVPLEEVERIEVLRGPASSLYGPDALGGVIHIVTRSGAGDAASAGVAVGQGDSGGIRAGLEGGSFGERRGAAALELGRADGAAVRAAGDWAVGDGHRSGTDFDVRRLRASAATRIGGARLHLAAGWAERAFGADGFYAPFPSWEETVTRTASAGAQVPSGRWSLEPRAWWRAHDDDFVLKRDDPAFYRNVHTSSQAGAEVVVRRALGGASGLALGGEWVHESLESTRLGDRTQDRRALFAEGLVRAGRGQVRAGLRVDDFESFGTFVAPSASAAVPLGGGLQARAAVGRAFRAPTWTERYYVDPANRGRPDLSPERAWTLEGGLDWAARAVAVRLTVFRRSTRDLIDWARTPAGDVWETRNVESADFTGLEVEVARLRLGPARLDVGASTISVDEEGAPGFESKYALRPVDRRLNVRLSAPLGARAHAAMALLRARRREQDAFTRLDLRLAFDLVEGGAVFVDVRNALDASYEDITRSPAPGRSLSVGLRTTVRW